MTRKRILTNRDFPDGKSWEAIEVEFIRGHAHYVWIGEDCSSGKCRFSFPIDEDMVSHLFNASGRKFDHSKVAV